MVDLLRKEFWVLVHELLSLLNDETQKDEDRSTEASSFFLLLCSTYVDITSLSLSFFLERHVIGLK